MYLCFKPFQFHKTDGGPLLKREMPQMKTQWYSINWAPALSKLAEKSIFLEAGVDYELPSDQNLQHFGDLLKIGYSAAEQGPPKTIVILECLN